MKLNKLSLYLLAMLSLVLSACSSDDYDWATVTGDQVYFSNETQETFELSTEATTFEVPIYRVKTDGAITVPVKATLQDGTIFTVPSNVTFAAGAKEAKIAISYDPSKIEFGSYEDITLSIAESTYTTVYGQGSVSFKAGATEWSDWAPYNQAGTCTYTYSLFWSGDDTGLVFQVRHNVIKTNLYQFKVKQCMAGIDLVLDYDESTGVVSCPAQFTGYTHSSYGDVYVADYNYYMETVRGKDPSDFNHVYGSFDKEGGYIDIPVTYYVSAGSFGSGYETITLDGYDRKDVSCGITYKGKLVDAKENPYIIANVTLGADVTSANVALVPGTLTQEVFDKVMDGSYEGVVTVEESGEVSFDASKLTDGSYTLLVISYYNDEAQSYATATLKYTTGGQETWSELGEGLYTYGAESYTQGGVKLYDAQETATLYQSSNDPSKFKITPWASSSTGLIFTVDANGVITVDGVETGDAHSKYGAISASDLVTHGDASAGQGYDSYVDGNTYNFILAYHVEAGTLAYQLDTFTLDAETAAKMRKAAKKTKIVKNDKVSLIRTLKKVQMPIFSLKK